MTTHANKSSTESDGYEVQSERVGPCIPFVKDGKHVSKRLKLDDGLECLSLQTDNEYQNPSAGKNEEISISNVQSKNSAILESHMKNSELPLAGTSTEIDSVLANNNHYQCIQCNYGTKTKQSLEDHMSTAHDKRGVNGCSELQTPHQGTESKSKTTVEKDSVQIDEQEINASSVGNMQDKDVCNSSSGGDMTGINKVDNLLRKNFSLYTLEEQLQIVRLGPHKPRDIQIHQSDKKQNWFFSGKWFDKVEWLTVSETVKKFFCFYCLLFGGESVWCKTGYFNIKHLSEKIKLHESTSGHLRNAVKYKTFGNADTTSQLRTDFQIQVRRHNETVDKNRHTLSKILDCIKFCATHELPLYENENECAFNRKVFLGLVSEVTNLDSVVHELLRNSTALSYTSEMVQNELLDCMYYIYQEELKKDIEKANFVSVQVEKIPNMSSKSHFAIILRYMKDGIAAERLYSLIEVENNTAVGLTEALKQQLIPLNIRCKLIAQTYDGTVTMRGPYGGVQKHMKEFFPHALFIHSYAHAYDTIIRQACSTVPAIKTFFTNVDGFPKFFSSHSKRSELLQLQCEKFPGLVENKWDSESDTIKTVYHNQLALSACCEIVKNEDGWDYVSVWEATQLADLLEDNEFLFFARFFYKIVHHLESLLTKFKARKSCGDIMLVLQNFETTVADMMETISEDTETPEKEFKTAANEACGIIISELRERFEATDHLITFSVIDLKQFRSMPKFPHDHLKVLVWKYRMLTQNKLTSELKVLYNNEAFAGVKSECVLLNLLAENELLETFSELCKLIEIAVATPVTPTHSANWVSTSVKLKNFMKRNVGPSRLNVFATLLIHRDFIESMPGFNSQVIEYFATKGTRRSELLYET